jgi:hypothetical protein
MYFISFSHFLYVVVLKGYLGDRMEDNCHIVKKMSLPRRVGDAFTNSLDSILFMTTYVVMVRQIAWMNVFSCAFLVAKSHMLCCFC